MTKEEVLKQYFGHDQFREGQSQLIDTILSGRDVLGIMPTGAGKSACYQVPAMLLPGITLVISPLISLMKDQVGALVQAGVPCAYINSSLSAAQYAEVFRRAEQGQYRLIYVAPERLATEAFVRFATHNRIAMITVDEAHCVSQWGQDFRPSYLKIVEFIECLPYRPIVSAFTATATAQVRADIAAILRLQDPFVLVTGFDRKNLYFAVQKPGNKLKALLEIQRRNAARSGIVYCATRKSVEQVCDALLAEGVAATRYHAGLPDEERRQNQDDFLYDRKTVMVATNAFGMGIDKSNVSYVVHYNMPKNLESYYQEAGRAGRDGEPAECTILYSGQDVRTNQFLIENSSDQSESMTEQMREEVRRRDRERLHSMTIYCTTTDCLRGYLLRYFGETAPVCCENCSNCNTEFERLDITVEAQKIASCVYRIAERGQAYGKTMIVDILRGSKNERVERAGLQTLSTYGIMADTSARRIRVMLDFLIESGYLCATTEEYPVLRLTKRAREILVERQSLSMKLPKEERKLSARVSASGTGVEDPVLFEKLRELRRTLAEAQHVPAYFIFPDAALRCMCEHLPQTEEAFLNIAGVGKAKMERYGAQFVALIREHAADVTLTESAQGI